MTQHTRMFTQLSALIVTLGLAGCGAADVDQAPALADQATAAAAGNGGSCAQSPYNCKLRDSGGNRVATNDAADNNAWALATGAPILDGNGQVMGVSSKTSTTFNYGQLRSFHGEPYAFAVSTSNGSAGWMPLASIRGRDSFAAKVGSVTARDPGKGGLGCYRVRDSHDPVLEMKKVVYDSQDEHERAGDYLPLVRSNGRRSANLTFNVPGFSLGGVAIDHFPAGTQFQRLDVPTASGRPSIDIPLYSKDAAGRYRRPDGTMKFIYGFVATSGGRRIGWMAYDALEAGCP